MSMLKQGDALSPIMFNITLKKVIRNIQSNKFEINIGKSTLDLLGFADDLNRVEGNKDITNVKESLEIRSREYLTIENYVFEKI